MIHKELKQHAGKLSYVIISLVLALVLATGFFQAAHPPLTADDEESANVTAEEPVVTMNGESENVTPNLIQADLQRSITVTSPQGGPSGGVPWPYHSLQTITWTSVNVPGTVSIWLMWPYPSSSDRIIIANTPNDGTENWFVETYPFGGPLPDNYLIIQSDSFPEVQGRSGWIDITPESSPVYYIWSPKVDDVWFVGSTYTIEWAPAAPYDYVSIEISHDLGNTWSYITANTENDGYYDWTVTGPSTLLALLRIRYVLDASVYYISPSPFEIATNYYSLTINVNGSGNTTPAPGNYTYPSGTIVD
jgi:hypothetical protein